jgi:FlaG/FlaF family flagellin (archaellin)
MKNNRVLFIVIGVILLCCCVTVIAAAIAYPSILKSFNSASSGLNSLNSSPTASPDSSGVPSVGPVDGGLSDPILKTDVWVSIIKAESQHGCANITSTAIDVAQQPDSSGVWVEDWSTNVCGTATVFEVTFTPDPKGGTNYDVKQK